MAQLLVDVNNKYGPVARVGPNHLVTDDPEFVKRMTAARSHYVRGPWFDSLRFDPGQSNISSERDTGKHNHLRHQVAGGYTGKELDNLERDVAIRIADFITWLDRRITESDDGRRPIEIANAIQHLTLDMITHLCYGYPLGFGNERGELRNFTKALETQLPIVQHFSVIVEAHRLLQMIVKWKPLRPYFSPSARDKHGVGVLMRHSREVIKRRYAPGAPAERDMLGAFKAHGITAEHAETEISISLVAGSDTTATSTRAILLLIITSPRVYRKLQQEIDDAASRGNLSSPISDAEALQMPYLQACIKEGMRRFPSITQLRERECPPEGDTYNGCRIPPGTFIGINAWGMQLNKEVYGSDADVFRPERWLEAGPEQLRAMMSVHSLIFGHGNTKCLGIPITMMNLNKIFVEVLRRYDVAIANPTRPWTSLCYGLFFQHDFNVIVSRRERAV